jgi:hypothetical protein
MTTKTIQAYLEEMQAAGHTLTDIVKALDSYLSDKRDSMSNSPAAQYLAAARNSTQTASMYLERYEMEAKSNTPATIVDVDSRG